MKRNLRIAMVSHCVLNQNSVLSDWERGRGAFKSIVQELLDEDLAIVQLPCPELMYLGVGRPPMNYEDYDTPEFRICCELMLKPTVIQIAKLVESGCSIDVLVGIENSPNCDLNPGKGVFMEVLMELLPTDAMIHSKRMVPEKYLECECPLALI